MADNGSTDGSQAYLRDAFPEVRLVELGQNRGFTGACNAGYGVSRGEFVCLLNNDTEADTGWLAAARWSCPPRPLPRVWPRPR